MSHSWQGLCARTDNRSSVAAVKDIGTFSTEESSGVNDGNLGRSIAKRPKRQLTKDLGI